MTVTPAPRTSWCMRLGEGEHVGLGRRVAGRVGQGLHPGGGGDVEDARRGRADHVGQERRGQRHRRLDQDPDLLELAGGVGLVKGAAGGKAGVVDQDLDVEPERLRCGRAVAGARPPWTRSAADRLGADAVLVVSSRGELVELLLAPRDEDQVVAAAGQLAGDLGADPGRGAGDQRGGRVRRGWGGSPPRSLHALPTRHGRRIPPNGGTPARHVPAAGPA